MLLPMSEQPDDLTTLAQQVTTAVAAVAAHGATPQGEPMTELEVAGTEEWGHAATQPT